MVLPTGFSKGLALFLAECCLQTYNRPGLKKIFSLSPGYSLIDSITGSHLKTLDFYGYIMESSESIVIAFRGSRTNPDWIADLTALQTDFPYTPAKLRVHSGFNAVYSSCRQQIISALKALSSSKQLFVTGHSLGGALAILCTLDAAVNTAFKDPVMYNFGSPRVGDPRFAESYNRLVGDSIRIVHTNDIVALLPPAELQPPLSEDIIYYRHVGKPVILSAPAGSIVTNHTMRNYIHGLKLL